MWLFIYFSTTIGIVVCKVLTGKKYAVTKVEKTAIPDGYHTKYVELNSVVDPHYVVDPLYVVPSPDLILPLGVIQCVKGAPKAPKLNVASTSGILPDLAGKYICDYCEIQMRKSCQFIILNFPEVIMCFFLRSSCSKSRRRKGCSF